MELQRARQKRSRAKTSESSITQSKGVKMMLQGHELTREHEKAMMIDQDGIDKLLDEVLEFVGFE